MKPSSVCWECTKRTIPMGSFFSLFLEIGVLGLSLAVNAAVRHVRMPKYFQLHSRMLLCESAPQPLPSFSRKPQGQRCAKSEARLVHFIRPSTSCRQGEHQNSGEAARPRSRSGNQGIHKNAHNCMQVCTEAT